MTIFYSLPFYAVVQESSPYRQTLAFCGVVNARLHIWARKSTPCFFGGMSMYVKYSIQETACFRPLKKEQSLHFSAVLGEKRAS